MENNEMAEKVVVSIDDGVTSGQKKLDSGSVLKWYVVQTPEESGETIEEKKKRLRAQLLKTQKEFENVDYKFEDPFGPAVSASDFEVYKQ